MIKRGILKGSELALTLLKYRIEKKMAIISTTISPGPMLTNNSPISGNLKKMIPEIRPKKAKKLKNNAPLKNKYPRSIANIKRDIFTPSLKPRTPNSKTIDKDSSNPITFTTVPSVNICFKEILCIFDSSILKYLLEETNQIRPEQLFSVLAKFVFEGLLPNQ